MANTRKSLSDDKAMTTLRMTVALKQQLETAARRNGRALSQEIENRLEESFRNEAFTSLHDSMVQTDRLMRKLQAAIFLIESLTENNWMDDQTTFAITRCAIDTLVIESMPSDPFYNNRVVFADTATLYGDALQLFESLSDQSRKLVDYAVNAVTRKPWRDVIADISSDLPSE